MTQIIFVSFVSRKQNKQGVQNGYTNNKIRIGKQIIRTK